MKISVRVVAMPIKVYVARAMAGRIAADVVREANEDKLFLEACGFTVLDPVSSEGVLAVNRPINSPKKVIDNYWPRDKAMIRLADALINMSPHLPSIGCIREHGFAQYGLKIPVVSVFPFGMMPREGAVCYYEDFLVTDSLLNAASVLWDHFKKRRKI